MKKKSLKAWGMGLALLLGSSLGAGQPAAEAADVANSVDEFYQSLYNNMLVRNENFSIVYNGDFNDVCDGTIETMLSRVCSMHVPGSSDDFDYMDRNYKTAGYNVPSIGDSSEFQFTVDYREPKSWLDQVNNTVPDIVNALNEGSDYQKIKNVHDFIVNLVTYDNSLTKYTAYEGFIQESTVCQGYSLMAYKLLTEIGIPCRYIYGYAGEAHAWNIVQLDGRWYFMDCTWDDPVGGEPVLRYDYFLVGSNKFLQDHSLDAKFLTADFQAQYPISAEDYAGGDSGTSNTGNGDYEAAGSNEGYGDAGSNEGYEETGSNDGYAETAGQDNGGYSDYGGYSDDSNDGDQGDDGGNIFGDLLGLLDQLDQRTMPGGQYSNAAYLSAAQTRASGITGTTTGQYASMPSLQVRKLQAQAGNNPQKTSSNAAKAKAKQPADGQVKKPASGQSKQLKTAKTAQGPSLQLNQQKVNQIKNPAIKQAMQPVSPEVQREQAAKAQVFAAVRKMIVDIVDADRTPQTTSMEQKFLDLNKHVILGGFAQLSYPELMALIHDSKRILPAFKVTSKKMGELIRDPFFVYIDDPATEAEADRRYKEALAKMDTSHMKPEAKAKYEKETQERIAIEIFEAKLDELMASQTPVLINIIGQELKKAATR